MNCRPLLLFVTAARDATLTATDERGRVLFIGPLYANVRKALCLPRTKRLVLAATRGNSAEHRYLLVGNSAREISAFFVLNEPPAPVVAPQQFTLVDETYSLPVNSAVLSFNG